MVHSQDSSRDDLGECVFDFRATDTIPDWANGGVACICYVGAKLKTLNDADAGVLRFILYTGKPGCTEGVGFRRHISDLPLLNLNFC